MTLAFRPLFALMLMSLASSSFAAKKKPSTPVALAAPAACVDFYGHVNDPWLRAHPLPIGIQGFSRWDELNASALRQTRELLGNFTRRGEGPASDLLADLAASAMDPARLDASVRSESMPLIAQINAIRKAKDIAHVVAAVHAAGVPVLVGFDAERDPDTGQARATLTPNALGMPDPAYYSSTAPELQRAISLYREYLAHAIESSGVSAADAQAQARSAFALEQSLAAAIIGSGTDAVTVATAAKSYPNLQLPQFMQMQGSAPSIVGVRSPAFFSSLNTMLAKPSIPQWQAYLRAQVMHSFAPMALRDARQPYLSALTGTAAPADLPTAERLAALSRGAGAVLLSSAYAEVYLTPARAQRANAIGKAIRASMGRAISRASWLSDTGKSESNAKLAGMQLAIGRAGDPPSMSGLVFDRGNYARNVLALRRWNRARSLARLGSAVWPLPVSQAQPVIGYQPGENRLVATAAVLQAPIFDGNVAATDYGSLGALLAQQMSLGFADYTEADGRALAARQAGLVTQFNAFPATTGVNVNGLRMLRQDAADLAGIEIAWDAFVAQGVPASADSQQFFRAWAALWARQDSAAALSAAQSQSAFAPAKWRVNGPLANTPAFAQAFSCKAGQSMTRVATEQLSIWR